MRIRPSKIHHRRRTFLPTLRPDPWWIATSQASRKYRKARRVSRRTTPGTGPAICERSKKRGHALNSWLQATDHGHPTARTADLYVKKLKAIRSDGHRRCGAEQHELFRARCSPRWPRMSVERGSSSDSSRQRPQSQPAILRTLRRNMGADIPSPNRLCPRFRPLLSRYGNEPKLTVILHPRRVRLQPGTRSARGHYPACASARDGGSRTAPKECRRLPRTRQRKRRLLQHGRLNEARAFPLRPGQTRCSPSCWTAATSQSWSPGTASMRTKPGGNAISPTT